MNLCPSSTPAQLPPTNHALQHNTGQFPALGRMLLGILFLLISNDARINAQSDFWASTSGPVNAYVSTLTVTSAGVIIAGTNTGIFSSSNLGDTWIARNDEVGSVAIKDLANCPNGDIVAATSAGVYRSTDNGTSWHPLAPLTGRSSTYSSAHRIIVRSDGAIFVGVVDTVSSLATILLSENGGENWDEIDDGLLGEDLVLDFAIDMNDKVYVATNGGGVITRDIFYSWDPESRTWDMKDNLAPELEITRLAVKHDGTIFAGTGVGMIRSTDGGESWKPADLWPRAIEDIAIAHDGTLFAATTLVYSVYRSTDDGATWTDVGSGLNGIPILSLAIGPGARLLAGSYGSGVFRSTSAVTGLPQQTNSGMPNGVIMVGNHPNPIGTSTVIDFITSTAGRVNLRIYDVHGAEISTLVDERMESGRHSIVWDASRLSSGIYICRIESEAYHAVTTMAVMRDAP